MEVGGGGEELHRSLERVCAAAHAAQALAVRRARPTVGPGGIVPGDRVPLVVAPARAELVRRAGIIDSRRVEVTECGLRGDALGQAGEVLC